MYDALFAWPFGRFFAISLLSCSKDRPPPTAPAGKINLEDVFVDVCDRTPQVRDAIVEATGKSSCAAVTDEDLVALHVLDLGYKNIASLKAGDFSGLDGLNSLWIYSNDQLTSLPSGVFSGLNLARLALDSNGLTRLPADAFSGLQLRELWLRGNSLTTLPKGIFSDLTNLEVVLLQGNQLASLPAGVFAGLDRLREISLGGNQLALLPLRAFAGLANLSLLDLANNPGAPFALDLKLERTDTSNLLAQGPADVVVEIAEGAPFEMAVDLIVVGGQASTSSLTIQAGRTTSSTVKITADTDEAVHIRLGPAPEIPGGFTGIEVSASNTLTLFAQSDKDWPVATGKIPSYVLQVGGPDVTVRVAEYFSSTGRAYTDEIESFASLFAAFAGQTEQTDSLAYSVFSNDSTLVNAQTDQDDEIVLHPQSLGVTSVIVTATNPDGLSASHSIPVIVLPAPNHSSFNIDLVFTTPVTEQFRSTAEKMALRWTEVITGDLPNVRLAGDFVDCDERVQDHRFFGRVDDLVLFVEVAPVIGGKGFAGPCGKREGSFLPSTARMVMDTEAAASYSGAYTILHEMGHALGIGTIWNDLGLVQGHGENSYFTGPRAIKAFNAARGNRYNGNKIPISTDEGHWNGHVFGWEDPRELMMDGGGTVMSAITIESLADIGYVVDVSKAEPFQLHGDF